MYEPLVSVVIPFYSDIKWLDEALESVNNQTYSNYEVLLINDGSFENLDKIADKYNYFVTIINKENEGPAAARNVGIEKAEGKYIAFLDADDLWMKSKLIDQVSIMEENNYSWSQHSYEYFWMNKDKTKVMNTEVYQGNIYKDCYISLKIQTSCVMVKKDVLLANGIKFSVNKRYGQDGEFYKQLARIYPLGYVKGVLSKFRIRGSNAGFRAEVQLGSRASTWVEIKKDPQLINCLPLLIKIAYRISFIGNIIVSWLVKKINITKKHKREFLYRIFYILPYFLFKIYAR